MKAFRIVGSLLTRRNWQNFTIEVAAKSTEQAKEILYSNLGSRHRLKRRYIKVEDIKEIQKEEITDPVVRYMIERGAVG